MGEGHFQKPTPVTTLDWPDEDNPVDRCSAGLMKCSLNNSSSPPIYPQRACDHYLAPRPPKFLTPDVTQNMASRRHRYRTKGSYIDGRPMEGDCRSYYLQRLSPPVKHQQIQTVLINCPVHTDVGVSLQKSPPSPTVEYVE